MQCPGRCDADPRPRVARGSQQHEDTRKVLRACVVGRQEVPQDYATLRLPNCEQAKNETALPLFHTHLLSEPEYMAQLLEAVEKVNGGLGEVRKHFQ